MSRQRHRWCFWNTSFYKSLQVWFYKSEMFSQICPATVSLKNLLLKSPYWEMSLFRKTMFRDRKKWTMTLWKVWVWILCLDSQVALSLFFCFCFIISGFWSLHFPPHGDFWPVFFMVAMHVAWGKIISVVSWMTGTEVLLPLRKIKPVVAPLQLCHTS